jgi:LysM repeat protein
MTEEQLAQMRQRFQNMSPEELATRRAQFSAQGGRQGQGGAAGGFARPSPASGGLIGAVITLLSRRAGVSPERAEARPRPEGTTPTPVVQAPATPTPVTPTPEAEGSATAYEATEPAPEPTTAPSPTPTPDAASGPDEASASVVYSVQPGDSLAAIARAYGVTLAALAEANGIADVNRIDVGQRLVIPNPSWHPTPAASRPAVGGTDAEPVPSVSFAPLARIPDTAPGPPFTIEISANRATQDPLVEKSRRYLVTGLVRNDGDRTYDVSSIDVTFYDASGFRGTVRKYSLVPGGEWLWHGQIEAEFPCLLLAPGEICPFAAEITGQDMASFLIHPNAVAVERQSATVGLSNLRLDEESVSYLRISGTATNGNPFRVRNVAVAAALLDANGEIVRLGSTYLIQDVEPGASVSFDLYVEKAAYVRYQLYAQAERH